MLYEHKKFVMLLEATKTGGRRRWGGKLGYKRVRVRVQTEKELPQQGQV